MLAFRRFKRMHSVFQFDLFFCPMGNIIDYGRIGIAPNNLGSYSRKKGRYKYWIYFLSICHTTWLHPSKASERLDGVKGIPPPKSSLVNVYRSFRNVRLLLLIVPCTNFHMNSTEEIVTGMIMYDV